MIKHIIFDFGGVILDLGGKHTGIPADLAAIFGVSVEEAEKVWTENKTGLLTGKETPREFLSFFIEKFNLQHDLEVSFQEWEKINIIPKEKIDWELVSYIEKLKAKYQIHMLTDQIDVNNGPAQWKAEIESVFHNLYRSYEEGYRKPDLEAYTNVLKKINAKPEECVFVDDSGSNIAAAESLGIHGVIYSFGKLASLRDRFEELGITL